VLLNSELRESFKILCNWTGNGQLYHYMENLAARHTRADKQRLRYITSIPDKGNKCRLVAISDYWTQILLEPIMEDVQNYTNSKFKGVSFNKDHKAGFEKLVSFLRPGVESYDVKS